MAAMLAWGARVAPEFRTRVCAIAARLACDPSWPMACMAFETGQTFDPAKRNPVSGATGLIQFMPSTAAAFGTSTDALARMTALEQLDYVERYFAPYAGKIASLSDCYMVVLWPAAVGLPDEAVIFAAGSRAYLQNRGLDLNHDNAVTKGECAALVAHQLEQGLLPTNATRIDLTQPATPIEDNSTPDAEPTFTVGGADNSNAQTTGDPPVPLAAMFLGPLLQGVIQMFAPRAQAALGKAGADPTIAGQLLNNLAQGVGQLVGVPVKDEASAIQAVAALQTQLASLTDEQKRQSETIKALQDKQLDFLHELTEAGETLVDIRKQEVQISTASADAASNRHDARALRVTLLKVVTQCVGAMAIGLFGMALIGMYYDPNHKPDPILLTAFVSALNLTLGFLAAYVHFSVGTTESSGAKDLVIGQMAQQAGKQS